MITSLAGENSFGLQRELQRRIATFVAEQGDLALERIDGEEASVDRIQEALTSLPFLANRKLVVLRDASKNKQFLEKAEQLLNDVAETTDVIIAETKLDKRLEYYKFLKSKTDFKAYDELDINGLASWLVATAKEQGGAISSSDARYLVERVGLNQQLLSNELEKLLVYDPQVTRKTIELLTDATPQSTIFELLEAAFAGNTKKALQLYGEQRALKVETPQIIAMLAWQLHIIATIKAAGERNADEIAQGAKLSPFVVKKSQGIARRVSLHDLKEQINNLLTIDLKSKRTNLDTDEALQHFLLNL
ncbi:MAG: polymerase subunit delta [Candidatus Saccharibacteria bacterium]|nr:polymerase subunit delta [Candidatus Saccharibacteria bacterium]